MQTIIKQKVVHPDVALIWPSRIIAKLRAAMEIPAGYQDEAGFHLGIEPVGAEVLQQPGFKAGN
jgi:hypothetical protein